MAITACGYRDSASKPLAFSAMAANSWASRPLACRPEAAETACACFWSSAKAFGSLASAANSRAFAAIEAKAAGF